MKLSPQRFGAGDLKLCSLLRVKFHEDTLGFDACLWSYASCVIPIHEVHYL